MTISELRIRSNNFVSDLYLHVSDVIDHNQKLVQLNKAQLKQSKTSKGSPLINSFTGSTSYSAKWAAIKGYSKPDLYDTGEFYKTMDILYNFPNDYFMTADVAYLGNLVDMYSVDIFGIENHNKAFAITTPMLSQKYKSLVL